MKLSILLLVLASCAAANPEPTTVATAPRPPTPKGPVHHVVVVSFDGLMPDAYVHPDARGLSVPVLRSIVARGAASDDGVVSVFPTVTYPAHTSMMTGVNPGKHGIVGNHSFDPEERDHDGWRWYAEDTKRPPVWALVEKAGYHAAIVHWPVTVGARVSWLVPEFWRAKDDNDRKLLRAVSTPGLLESVAAEHPDFWPRYAPPDVEDSSLADIATFILEKHEPALLIVHFVGVDGAQHAHGLWSKEALAAIEEDDRQLGRILATIERTGMQKDTNVIVVSDHGFMGVSSIAQPCSLLRDAGLVTLQNGRVKEWKAAVYPNGGTAYVYLHDPADAQTRDKALALFTNAARTPDASGIGRVYGHDEVVALGGDPDAAFALEAAPGVELGARCSGESRVAAVDVAAHGWDPRRPEMRASLLMTGATVPHGVVVDAHLVDVAPTIAGWLGLSMTDVDGKPLVVKPR